VYNKPTTEAGGDVWKGLPIDYQGKDVTAENFLNVISGNSTALPRSKVVKSGPNDNVFIFYSDHGSPGLIAMPYGPVLTVGALKNTLINMSANKQFGKLVFYLEACESGSMFDGWLTDDYRIYATTAANSVESSWGFYCPPQDAVRGTNIRSCLGDEYSISFLESVDAPGGYDQTLQANYEYLKKQVKGSHVQQFGDLSFANLKLKDFLAEPGHALPAGTVPSLNDQLLAMTTTSIDSRDIQLSYLYNLYMDKTVDEEERFETGLELVKEMQSRLSADMRFRQLSNSILGASNSLKAATVEVAPAVECGKCCEEAYNFLSTTTGECKFTDYSLRYGRVIQNVCMMNKAANEDRTEVVMSKLRSVCSKSFF